MTHERANQYRGISRQISIPACVVSWADLRRLYEDLSEKANEALERHISGLERPVDSTEEGWTALKQQVRTLGALSTIVIGENGEQNLGQSAAPLAENQLPDRVMSVVFDSALTLQNANIHPLNRFRMVLDFTQPTVFGVYNPWEIPTPNGSTLEITGADRTWAAGVSEFVLRFFRGRHRRRRWLHTPVAFNLLNWFLALPSALWIIFRLDDRFTAFFSGLHGALRGAIYVYVVLLSLFVFRMMISGFRWAFPLVEIEDARSGAVRAGLNIVVTSLVLALLYDVLKTLFS